MNLRFLLTIIIFTLFSNYFKAQNLETALKHFHAKEYKQAADEFDRLIPPAREKLGANDTSLYSKILLYAAASHEHLKNYSKAMKYYNDCNLIYVKVKASDNPYYATSCHQLGSLYMIAGKTSQDQNQKKDYLKKATLLFEKALPIREKNFGKENSDYLSTCSTLADLYKFFGNYPKALPLATETREICIKLVGKTHEYYLMSCYNLAELYQLMNEFEKSLPLYLETKSLIMNQAGKKNDLYLKTINNLAIVYFRTNKIEQSEKHYLELLNLLEKFYGKNNQDYAFTCHTLADLYTATNKLDKAKKQYEEAKNIRLKLFGEQHPHFAQSCMGLANVYLLKGKPQEAEHLLEKAKYIFKNKEGKNHELYLQACISLATLYKSTTEYDKAIAVFKETVSEIEKLIGSNHPDYATACNSLAELYMGTSQIKEAEPLLKKALEIREKTYGNNNIFYAETIVSLGALNYHMGQWDTAEKLIKKSKNILESQSPVNHALLLKANYNLAMVYKDMGDYDKSHELFRKVSEKTKELVGKEHPDYAMTLINIASIYQISGDYTNAQNLYEESVEITKKKLGPNHLTLLNNELMLAVLFMQKGEYQNSEKILLDIKSRVEKNMRQKHPFYANVCTRLADLYKTLGNYQLAEPLYIKAQNLLKEIYSDEHPVYAVSCNMLALFYFEKLNFAKTKEEAREYSKKIPPLYLKAKNIYEKTLGKEHIEYASVCNNIALYYKKFGKYDKSIPLFQETIEIIKKSFGKEHSLYSKAISNLAENYVNLKNYPKADSLYNEAIIIHSRLYSKEHPEYLNYCSNRANLQTMIAQSAKNKAEKQSAIQLAEKLFLEANEINNKLAIKSSKFMNEEERERYLNYKVNYIFDVFHSFFLTHRHDNELLTGVVYNNAINLKGQLLKSGIALRKIIFSSKDTSLRNMYNNYRINANKLSEQNNLPVNKQIKNLKELDEKVTTIEKNLISQVSKLTGHNKYSNSSTNWQEVRKSLNKNETAIEFVKFRYFNSTEWTDKIYYYALILNKDNKNPQPVFLFEEKKLDKLIKRKYEEDDYNYVKRLYSSTSGESSQLYNLVFRPIEKHLKNTATIYLSPTGLLNRIAFDALISDSSKILSDKYNLFYTSSTAFISNKKNLYHKDINSAALFGGIDYSLSPEEMAEEAKKINQTKIETEESPQPLLPVLNNSRTISNLNSTTRNITWSYLAGSLSEAEKISIVFAEKKVNFNIYKERQGNEEQFKSFDGKSPSILHVATHGFYFGDDERSDLYRDMMDEKVVFTHSANPLMRSGFILAGGNNAFQGEEIPKGVEDGVLTALEISRMNLFNTKLAVLSACQTGLGDVKGSEGVYGLQRAFKMAGVDYLIFSLWEVPDFQTQELMANFYNNWFSGLEIREAFKKAQNHLKTKYAQKKGSAFAWAAFVLMN